MSGRSIMSTFTTYIEDDRGEEVKVRVSYDYQPAEAQTLEYPGCAAGVEITGVLHSLTDNWYNIDDDLRDKLEQEAWDDMKSLASAMEDY
jgi:hypothetical protein